MEVESLFTGFANRGEAGHRLAKALPDYRGRPHTMVVGLPRGGVVTAAAVAEDLDLPLDVLVVRKLGVSGHPELVMGAIGPGGVRVLNREVITGMGIPAEWVQRAQHHESLEMDRRERLYRDGRAPVEFGRKTVIIVDDGLATGATMEAAVAVIRRQKAARIVLAVPVAPIETLERFRASVEELVYLETPEPFRAVGDWYVDFEPVDDADVKELLEEARWRVKGGIHALV